MTLQTKTLADILPVQDHYCLLHDGVKYARHGTGEANGLLVFEDREGADQFCQTVGKALPAFQPVRVDAEEFLRLFEEVGAVCVADGLKIVVATLRPTEPVNPEGVVPEDSNWEPAKRGGNHATE
jgi:hypothetical protein